MFETMKGLLQLYTSTVGTAKRFEAVPACSTGVHRNESSGRRPQPAMARVHRLHDSFSLPLLAVGRFRNTGECAAVDGGIDLDINTLCASFSAQS